MKPNILFISVDQMRGDCLSALGHPVVQTPYLDNLVRQG
ncbi:MAG: arylsulfatase, partial [Paenibacillaceae bacterium]|nr:arylsulfatase [Paenibacillaceae bacterium]